MTLHVIGATGFFIEVFYVLLLISNVVKSLWKVHPGFISTFSYYYKVVSIYIILIFAVLELVSKLDGKLFPNYFGNVLEWSATFVVLVYMVTFTSDFKNVDVYFTEDEATSQWSYLEKIE